MLNWIKRHWILSLFLLVGGVPAGLNYSGFCWDEKRWLSDEEMIHGAVSELLSWHTVTINFPVVGNQSVKLVNEPNVEEFMKNNPDCCKVSNGKDTVFEEAVSHSTDGIRVPNIEDKILGNYRKSVAIYYNQKYLDLQKLLQIRQKSAFISMTNCGIAYNWPR